MLKRTQTLTDLRELIKQRSSQNLEYELTNKPKMNTNNNSDSELPPIT